MHAPASPADGPAPAPEPVLDVLIVGAGLSGIGAAATLGRRCPGKRYAILEAREAMGGTWDLFRYPGIRSDSDMYTLGYGFRPWRDPQAIAGGPAIRAYIEDTARACGIDENIRYGHRVLGASWCSRQALWSVEARLPDGSTRLFRTRFLYLCSGYYRYDQAYRPRFEGEKAFRGRIVQPQFWPRDFDYTGKRVVVIGSGATAVTVVPAMSERAAHVTMLQRSPGYVVARPGRYRFAERMRALLPESLAWRLVRTRVIGESMFLYWLARSKPELVKRKIVEMAAHGLGSSEAAAQHFTPRYKPWDQRVCVAPDGDLFEAVRAGRASVVTDHIDRFTPNGILLQSGRELEADVVVMATGLTLQLFGGATLVVDGRVVDPSRAMSYKGMMLSDVPNCALAFGYTNASWTLKADLTAEWVCRLLRHMDARGQAMAVAPRDPGVPETPFLDFDSGYVERARHLLPQQGAVKPWRVYQNYLRDLLTIRFGRIEDGVLRLKRLDSEGTPA
ncbi:NAD(P)/FAD-dependent oxidoreductase [Massilia sp. G4R7]|uniref:NAD(P)/FAD-dependent oxidoreductase n=1 Tax=Massilia phyllostachyos TaxID=2898585 RepID=A0ABS8QBH7_9BURK|nr:NAD(P)/FAD-dependent oxidoreductase [Massilia phyllostachyos]MCD2519120.1 NAD(P)/FAD-dependent oxidoreductase [Massilia phyllostachyos]